MATTTNVLDGGIAFNEWHAVSFTTDYNGVGGAGGANDGWMEFVNTSTTTTIDIGGYQFWTFNGTTMVVAHTVPVGTMLTPGETYTVVSDHSSGGGTPTGITGQSAIADIAFTQTDFINMFLVDPSGNYIVLTESGGEAFLAGDETAAGLNPANLVGQDIVDRPPNDQSVARQTDGDDTFVNQAATPGTPNCFLTGSLIATPSGEVRVEDLEIGDRVLTTDGRDEPVRWLGRQTVRKLFSGPHMQPVRIRAGALGDGSPHSDLTVTANHGMIIDDLVVNASALVNGFTIDWVPMDDLPGVITFYHVETEHHDEILANGAPAETFIDYTGRQAFDNYHEYLDRYGYERIIPEMQRPRISSRRQLPKALCERLGVPTFHAQIERDFEEMMAPLSGA